MKVIIKNSDFFYKGKMIKEGSEADLPNSEVEANPNILIPVTGNESTAPKRKSKKKSK